MEKIEDQKPLEEKAASQNNIETQIMFFGIAIVFGIGLAFGTIAIAQFIYSDHPSAYVAMINTFVFVLPALAITLAASVGIFLKANQKAALLLSIIWAPSIIVWTIITPSLEKAKVARYKQQEKEADIYNKSLIPGTIVLTSLSREGLPSSEIEAEWKLSLDPQYDGYQLTKNNQVELITDFAVSPNKKVFPLNKTDYSMIEPMVRLDGGANLASPKNAWLWPRQVSTMIFAYKDHAESAPVIYSNHLTQDQLKHITSINLANYTGKNIIRVKVNGWDLAYPHFRRPMWCANNNEESIPTIIDNEITLQWQIEGEETWYSATRKDLPPEPQTPAGKYKISQSVNILLTEDKTMAIRRNVIYIDSPKDYISHEKKIEGIESPSFSEIEKKYSACIPFSKEWPIRMNVSNLTPNKIKDLNGIFGFLEVGVRNEPHRYRTFEFYEHNFSGTMLKRDLKLKLQEQKDSKAGAIRDLTVPLPDNRMRLEWIKKYPTLNENRFQFDVFVYPDSIESAWSYVGFQEKDFNTFTDLNFTNLTGKTIARFQINGMEIAPPLDANYSFQCSSTPYHLVVPHFLDKNIIRWQHTDSQVWHQAEVQAKQVVAHTLPSTNNRIMSNLYLKQSSQLLTLVKYGTDQLGYARCKDDNCTNADPSEKEAKAFLSNTKECVSNEI